MKASSVRNKVRRAMMAEGNDMDEEVKVEEEEGCSRGEKREQLFVLLLRVTQALKKKKQNKGN